jgi:hypothetical protein
MHQIMKYMKCSVKRELKFDALTISQCDSLEDGHFGQKATCTMLIGPYIGRFIYEFG